MKTCFMVYFNIPDNFSDDDFKLRLESAFKRHKVTIKNLQQLKDSSLPKFEGDLISYSFETDYDFGLDRWIESEHYDIIMNSRIKDAIDYFNEKNPEKLRINIIKRITNLEP